MSALGELILRRIRAQGPLTIADYMTDCLAHPTLGYYPTRDPLGASGDFTTAPEISQMFGEMIGLAMAQAWMDQGSPASFILAELGPGRGTLMADILRATAPVAGFHAALSLHFIEISPSLRAEQAKLHPDATWHDTINSLLGNDLPNGPLYIVANEFYDALPIRQFTRAGAGWRECLVGEVDGALSMGLGDETQIGALAHRVDAKQGDIVEYCPALPSIAALIAHRITDHGGAAIYIDYGNWRSLGDTFQALRGHKSQNPLLDAGNADLTAHVDFEALSMASAAASPSKMTPQGVFLERLGITERAQNLAKNLQGDALNAHIAAHKRLTHPDEMGHLFQILGVVPYGARPIAGLDI